MVYEENCESCGRPRLLKYCKITKMNVCYTCCIDCKIRYKCDIRVWFKNLAIMNK